MAEAGVSFLLESLKQLALHRYDLYKNAENEFQLLEHELNAMKAVLEDASRNPRTEENFKAWERQVREVVYDAEDTIDSWTTEGNSFLTLFSASIAQKVKDLRQKTVAPAFNSARAEFANMSFSETGGSNTYDARDRENKAPRNQNVVGLSDEIDLLVEKTFEGAEELDVISIIGMPGLGKTTVAWQIFDHHKIQQHFLIRIWIYVSQDFNKKDILLTIMEKFSVENLSTKNENELSIMVKEKLAQYKFILFMDDVWTPEVWTEIKRFLPMDNVNGTVVVTSRELEVGRRANGYRKPHPLRPLKPEESLELLQIETFGRSKGFPAILEPICKIIVKHCNGLPLAVIVIGGILADKRPPGRAMIKPCPNGKTFLKM